MSGSAGSAPCASLRARVSVDAFEKKLTEFSLQGEARVIVCFKRLGEKKDEPFLNRVCVWATSSRADVMPGGRMSHVEIMFENEGTWWRFSIVKATRITTPDGTYEWKPGTVHCRLVRACEMRHYDFYAVYSPRQHQARAWYFLKSQVGCEFNTRGYMFNFLLPVPISGVCKASDIFGQVKPRREIGAAMFGDIESPGNSRESFESIPRLRWFCSEIVCVAFQLLDLKDFVGKIACQMSPNGIWRIVRRLPGSQCTNPVLNIAV